MNNTRIFILIILISAVGGYAYYYKIKTEQTEQVDKHPSKTESQETNAQVRAAIAKPSHDAMLIGHPIEFSHVWRDTAAEQVEAFDMVTSKNFMEELKNIAPWNKQDAAIWEGTFNGQIQFDQSSQVGPKVEVVLDKLSDGQRRFNWSVKDSSGQAGKSTETLWQDDSLIPYPSISKYVERDETSYVFSIDLNEQTAYAHMFSPGTDPNYFVGIIYVASQPDVIGRVGTITLQRLKR